MPMLKSILFFLSLILSASSMWGVVQDSLENSLNLKIIVIERAGLYPCAADPPAERERERARAAAEFAQIRKDSGNFTVVALRLGFRPDARFTRDEQLLLHCYYAKLQAVRLKPEGDRFKVITGGDDEDLYIDAKGRLTDMRTSVAVPSVSRPLSEMSVPSPPPAVPVAPPHRPKLTAVAQRHHLITRYGHLSSCSPISPVSGGYGYEEMERADPEAFAEIRRLRGMTAPLSAQAKHDVLTEYETMQSIGMEPLVEGSYFELTLATARGIGTAMKVEGIVSAHGRVRELRREVASVVCPK